MPSISKAQQHLMAAAEHGATFPMARKLRNSMSHSQLHEFSFLKGSGSDIGHENMKSMKNRGFSEFDATKAALKHPHRHKNLGKYLHPKRSK